MNNKFFITILVLSIAAFACSLPGGEGAPTGEEPDLAATITSQALTLAAPTNTPAPPTETPTPQFTSTPESTATPSVPIVTVSTNTNCRTGPGTVYDLIGALNVGQSAEVVGKFPGGGYWIIKTPGSSGTCWLWSQYATVSGNTSNLPDYPAPPTPTPSIPAAATNFNVNISCSLQVNPVYQNKVTINMSWTDNATNETGYRVFRNGELLKTLDANTTSTGDETTLPAIWIIGSPVPSVTYAVEAYNATGASARVSETVSCP